MIKDTNRRVIVAASMVATATLLMLSEVRVSAKTTAELVVEKVENKIRSRFTNPENPKQAEIKIIPYENEALTAQGRLKTVVIRSTPAMIKKVPAEQISMRADDVRIDVKRLLKEDDLVTISTARTEVEAIISESNLDALFARGRHTKDMKLKTKFEDGKVRISGYWKLFMFKGPIETVGRLVITPDNNLNYELDSLKLNDREAPASVKKQFMQRLNPVVEFNDLPFKPRIRSIKFKGDKVYVST